MQGLVRILPGRETFQDEALSGRQQTFGDQKVGK